MAASNPVAFKPFAVTFWTTITYIALIAPLIVVHETVPSLPSNPTLYSGLNLTKSWLDLTTLSRDYHPFNSRANDEVHDWLLLELEEIKRRNGANDSSVVVFADNVSNITTASTIFGPPTPAGTYFEGTNVLVYVRGKDDPQGRWWEDGNVNSDKVIGKGGVLMNAHYDSVASGFGATDDGMGCVTLIALVDYFSRPENRPQRGIVALFNNNEEDGLWGAQAFIDHPLQPFCHTFLNLEGAGAGGRANLFRATDAEVTNAYKGTKDPFGTVISSDAFGLGAIKSNTDYIVFNEVFGLRGLDLAFYRPRARYHTNQDDAKHASRASLWHMLSSSLHTVQGLSGDTGETFIGERPDGDRKKVWNGRGNDGVWFDIFGKGFALFDLRTLFAWSLTLLIAAPLILMSLTYVLIRTDKYYFFSARRSAYEGSELDPVTLGGRKGLFRFPFALVVSGALVVGSAYLITKINPMVIYSNEYTVWAMMISLFYFVFWTIMAGANFARPSALHRGYSIFWLFTIAWGILVADTVFEDRFRIAAGYIFVFFHSATFLASFISLCELFALPTKASFAQQAHDEHDIRDHINAVPHTDDLISPSHDELNAEDDGNEEDESQSAPTETTPLVGGGSGENRQTFATTYRRSISSLISKAKLSDSEKDQPYVYEQQWSANIPSWVWVLQFIILGPFLITLTGQNGLTLVASVSQTGADGSSLLLPYLMTAFFSIFLLLPITPFIHRITHHVPMTLLVVFGATLIYNLTAFPFTEDSRYKVYFQNTVDLDTGISKVHYVGLRDFVEQIIAELPSAMGKELECTSTGSLRPPLASCSYDGSDVPPNVVKTYPEGVPPQKGFTSWLDYNITRVGGETKARFEINARESRSCAITFKKPISSFKVGGNSPNERFGAVPEDGLTKVKLYRRDWTTPWQVDVQWDTDEDANASSGIDGRILCSWDDVNIPGTIPAYDEGLKYTPTWVALSKLTSGLCEGSKAFKA
ncbi:peptidase family M28 family [Hypoxylon trugodes]|uniref:peptidase family M28 family n=1 Tax=Hypoxylon trugodes TaxID=326681 RepID=UPI00219988CD|nr:peptidase family M28 family [Hypoxylon trugodes]KAI1390728.1 peptidase family M28 family [Hypoxylon trugodes]